MSLRDELIQVAAVACAIVEDLDTGATGKAFDGWYHPRLVALHSVENERWRQEAKWGPQHHTPVEWLMILLEEVGEVAEGYWILLRDHGEADLLQRAAYLGQAARQWCQEHDWPDPKHRAIHQGEGT